MLEAGLWNVTWPCSWTNDLYAKTGIARGTGTSPSSHTANISEKHQMKNCYWVRNKSHALTPFPIILFPLDSECRRKVSYIHSWEAVTSPMTTTALFLLVPSIMAHHFLLQQSLAGAWTVLKTGLAPCPSAQWFVSLGFYLVNQVNHVLKHLRCFSFCNIFLLFCQLSDCVFSSLTEEYLE